MQPIGDVLGRVLSDLGLQGGVQGWRAVERWADAVGPRIAQHTRAVSFREGTLTVEVDGSAWMHELGFLKRDLLRRLRDTLVSDDVRDVRFTIPRGGNRR